MVTQLVPWGVSCRSVSANPTFASTRRDAVFQSQTVAQSRSVPSRCRPAQDRPRSLGGVSLPPGPAQELEGQLRLLRPASAVHETAVADGGTHALRLDREQSERDPVTDRIASSKSVTAGRPSASMRRCGGTRGSRSAHISRWMGASDTRHGLSNSRSVSSTSSGPWSDPPAMRALFHVRTHSPAADGARMCRDPVA